MASYTFGKILTNNLGYYGSAGVAAEGAYWVNAYDPEANYGRAFHDIRHNFVFAANYELPWGKGKKWGTDWSGVTNGILGGWKVSAIFQARTGFPITVQNSQSTVAPGHAQRGVAELRRRPGAGQPEHHVGRRTHPTTRKWLDINAFQKPALGTFGNCGIGIADAPGYTNVDASLSKRFNMGGPRYLEFRAEAFNLLNHPKFGPPGRDINTPSTFGIITSTVGSPRVVEFVVKFFF